jgi:hypothetical protein
MKKWMITAAAMFAVGFLASTVRAEECKTCGVGHGQVWGSVTSHFHSGTGHAGCSGPGCGGFGSGGHGFGHGLGHGLTHPWAQGGHPFANHPHNVLGLGGQGMARQPVLPVYMAAPWYLYWPYDGHFQTVAPMAAGVHYPPPVYTGNPYLSGQYPGYVPGNPIPQFPYAAPPVAGPAAPAPVR